MRRSSGVVSVAVFRGGERLWFLDAMCGDGIRSDPSLHSAHHMPGGPWITLAAAPRYLGIRYVLCTEVVEGLHSTAYVVGLAPVRWGTLVRQGGSCARRPEPNRAVRLLDGGTRQAVQSSARSRHSVPHLTFGGLEGCCLCSPHLCTLNT